MTEQIVVRIQFAAIGCEHSIIPHAISEKQEIFRHIFCLGCLIGQHTQITAIGIGIWGSTGKLIIQFISRNNVHTKTIMAFVEFLQSLSLLQQFLGCRNDDDHISRRICMMILVGDAINILGSRHLLTKSYKWHLGFPTNGNIIQAHRTSRQRLDGNRIFLLYIGKDINSTFHHTLGIRTSRTVDREFQGQRLQSGSIPEN